MMHCSLYSLWDQLFAAPLTLVSDNKCESESSVKTNVYDPAPQDEQQVQDVRTPTELYAYSYVCTRFTHMYAWCNIMW